MRQIRINKFVTITSMALIIAFVATAQEAEKFQVANQQYQNKEYTKAIENYESILSSTNSHSAELYFNLANAYYKNNQIGKAIVNYERASKLSPNDPDIKKNLGIIRNEIKDQIESIPPFFLKRIWNQFRDLLTASGWAIGSIFFLWIAAVGYYYQVTKKTVAKRLGNLVRFYKPALILSIGLMVLAILKDHSDAGRKEAILITPAFELKTAPDAKSPAVMQLHEGIKFKVTDKIEDWYKVKLSDGMEGWLPEDQIDII